MCSELHLQKHGTELRWNQSLGSCFPPNGKPAFFAGSLGKCVRRLLDSYDPMAKPRGRLVGLGARPGRPTLSAILWMTPQIPDLVKAKGVALKRTRFAWLAEFCSMDWTSVGQHVQQLALVTLCTAIAVPVLSLNTSCRDRTTRLIKWGSSNGATNASEALAGMAAAITRAVLA